MAVPAQLADKRVLVIGDLHGHRERLQALLAQQDLLARCAECRYGCRACGLTGWVRTRREQVAVVQVGDFGHWGERKSNPERDWECLLACEVWCDLLLWGNHDRAIVQDSHRFAGYHDPGPLVRHRLAALRAEGKLVLAAAAHGWLITHAGLHASWQGQHIGFAHDDPEAVARWLNGEDTRFLSTERCDPEAAAVRDAVGGARGGASAGGGVLWRDFSEPLYRGFPQVFGHTADHQGHRVRPDGAARNATLGSISRSWCVDAGDPEWVPGGRVLAGIWLPDEHIAAVALPDLSPAEARAAKRGEFPAAVPPEIDR